ncbi:pseudouridine synthase [Entophlyctis helioformis]|nr:pseudouridine synthase [Entophlyctis helioformis]
MLSKYCAQRLCNAPLAWPMHATATAIAASAMAARASGHHQSRGMAKKTANPKESKSPMDLVQGVYNPPTSMSKRTARRWASIAPTFKSSKLEPNKPDTRSATTVKSYVVDHEHHEAELAAFLGSVSQMDKYQIRKKILDGWVWVDGSAHASQVRVHPRGVLAAGDVVNVTFAVKTAPSKMAQLESIEEAISELKMRVLYRDDHIFVIDKEHGLASQGGTKVEKHLDRLVEHLEKDDSKMPRLVHRLDKNTSGAMIIARTKDAARRISAMFQQPGRITRRYIAILTPPVSETSGLKDGETREIVTGIASNGRRAPNERMQAIEWYADHMDEKTPEGHPIRKAVTLVTVLQTKDKASAVCLEPQTGRKHQLRLHCADVLQSYILGDYKYGKGSSKDLQRHVGDVGQVPMHLHLGQLVLRDYFGKGSDLAVAAKVPEYFRKTMASLKLDVAVARSLGDGVGGSVGSTAEDGSVGAAEDGSAAAVDGTPQPSMPLATSTSN